MYKNEFDSDLESLVSKLPKPTGFKLVVAVAQIDDKKGEIILPDQYTALEQTASILGHVMLVGPDAYKDPAKFPSGPYCQEGDWVMFRSYSGTRFKLGSQEFRMINDDQIEAIVGEPTLIERAM